MYSTNAHMVARCSAGLQLKIVAEDNAALRALCHQTPMTAADFERYYREERDYIDSLTKEPDDVKHTVEYMDALVMLYAAQ